MALEESTKLGHYEEIHFLGVGSSATDPELAAKEVMGGVYRATIGSLPENE